jgi:hypothetical protein
MGTANGHGVVEAIAEAMGEDGVVHRSTAALSVRSRKVLVGWHPVAQPGRDRLEVGSPSKLLGTEAAGHLAGELRDVTLLGRLDEDSFHAKLLQLGCDSSTALTITVNA